MSNDLPNFLDFTDLEAEDAKQVLRAKVRKARNERSETEKTMYAEQWVETVLEYVKDYKQVAAFVSVANEPPTHELCKAIADSGKTLLLPKLGPGLTRAWGYFQGLDDLHQLAPGRPPEPSGPAFDNDVLQNVEAMIVPALLVSKYGERLGQGGGWYDRVLKQVRAGTPIGALIFPEEFVDFHLPQDEYDVPVCDAILPQEIIPLR
ncbi:5-formyltetrahydrofolate cyclo-ligase [Arcanobacterium hippocoleae]|uniref:5-formyltetrahydrofolate cyclo-ligase n=1 Tax=Arcanobacterium hippocoleae TaxID=149017 RepID=A0ABU1T3E0_9ACTO|nr:5-formyltetrahydrofolate cyclo-ligase [Arcanobacterium hippocoleae]MDR6939829.1 5-formyltetrahydrofolate cyclo-ligase [Arcanobacterium hippocoleae]